MKHTPGSWEFIKSDFTVRVKEWNNCPMMGDARGCIIADLKPAIGCSREKDLTLKVREHCIEEALANAQIIAAAPDLLEALKSLVEAKETASENPEILQTMKYKWEKAMKAIEKAEGEK